MTLIAAATIAPVVSTAQDEVYGLIDLGLSYYNENFSGYDNFNGSQDYFSMGSGIHSGSRFGFRGREELGDGWAVAFTLENGFNADTGKFGGSSIFGREALLSLESPYGTFSFGKTATFGFGSGSYAIFMSRANVLESNWNGIFGNSNGDPQADRVDNAVVYKSPTFAGMSYAMYSFGRDA